MFNPKKPVVETYTSLGTQAENLDTYEAYKQKIDLIKNMNYEELFNIMRDTEDALKVLIRNEAKASICGILSLTEDIVKLGNKFMEQHQYGPFEIKQPAQVNTEYTYEFIKRREREGKL